MKCSHVLPALIASAALFLPLQALAGPMTHEPGAMAMAEAPAGPMAEGLIKKVDKSRGRLTIKHGPLESLNMPPMTMVFRVKDAAMLDAVQAGDKVNFIAEDVDGKLTVTRIEAAR